MSDHYQLYYHNDPQQAAFKALRVIVSHYAECCISAEFNEFQCDAYVLLDQPDSNRIAIDWDNTFTAHPKFYQALIKYYLRIGFKPIICTLRSGDPQDIDDIYEAIQDFTIPVFSTDGQLKRPYMQQKGLPVNLWIDDFFPGIAHCDSHFIVNNGIHI